MIKTLLTCLWVSLFACSAQALCTREDKVRLRSRPDAKGKVSWTVPRNTPLVETTRKGAWLQVRDFEGHKHWVHARSVTSQINCVMVRTKTAKLRSGPGSQFGPSELGSARKYAAFKKIGRDEEWLKVQDNFGHVHWAHEMNMWEPRNYSRVSF